MIIVTDQQFILAESILHMSLMEERELEGSPKKGGGGIYRTVYTLNILYKPQAAVTTSLGSSRDTLECQSRFYNKKEAKASFLEVVKQYREQNPDALYLDKILESVIQKED
jgi:hypothetical protein